MPDVTRHEPDLALALDRLWDAVLSGRDADPDDLTDTGLAATVRRAHDLDALPEPDAAFALRLCNDLIDTSKTLPAASPQAATPLPATRLTSPEQMLGFPPQRLSLRIAAAVLLVALLTGSALVTLYPHWSRQVSRSPLFAPQAVATATPGVATAPVLELTIPELRDGEAYVEFLRTWHPPLETIEIDNTSGNAPQIHIVEEGAVRVQATQGHQSVRVLRGGVETNQIVLDPGQPADVGAGDGIVIEMGGAAELTGAGPEPAVLLMVLGPTNLGQNPWALTLEAELLGGGAEELIAPLRLSASRVTLAPDSSLAATEVPNVEHVVVGANTDRAMDLRTGRNGFARNAGDEPLDVYVVSLTSAPAEQEPIAPTPLLDVTITEPSAFRAMVFIDSSMFPPGGSLQETATESPMVIYVAEGELSAKVLEGSRTAFVVPPGTTGPIEQGKAFSTGEQAVLGAGSTFVAPPHSTIEVANTGDVPARAFWLLASPRGSEKTKGGVNYESEASSGGALHELTPIQHVVFDRVPLEPGASLTVPDSGTTLEYVVRDSEQMTELRRDSAGALHNAGDEPLEVYVLTVSPASGSAAVAPEATPGTALLDQTLDTAPAYLALTETPAFEAWAGTATTHFPPGSSVHDVAGDAPEVVYVAAGALAARVERAPWPVEVIRPGEATQLLEESQGAILAAGSALSAPAGSIIELANEASAPAEALFLLVAANSTSTPAGGVKRNAGPGSDSGTLLKLASPARFLLRKAVLAGGDALPVPRLANSTQIAYPLDATRLADVRRTSDGSLRNSGAEPMAVYALTITSGAAGSLAT